MGPRVSVSVDHVGIPSTDPEAAANFVAWVLGEGVVVPDGPPDEEPDDMFSLLLDGWSLAFVRTLGPPAQHLAFRVSAPAFADAVERLRERGLAFGNDPDAPTNGRSDDPLGGLGRAYVRDPDGHLYELVVAADGGTP